MDSAADPSLKRRRTPDIEVDAHNYKKSRAEPAAHSGDDENGHNHGHVQPPAFTASGGPVPGHLQINYLLRRYAEDMPLISPDNSMTSALNLLNGYYDAMERSESLANNLGARPRGAMLIKRFERMFDGPPRAMDDVYLNGTASSNEPDSMRPTVNWLDVVDFSMNNPDQFQLTQLEDGGRGCVFSVKGCRVHISEEEWMVLNSGMPQRMIPPQPLAEDEERELGTLEILEASVTQISHLADQVAARARQFNHRLRGRKEAIVQRRAASMSTSAEVALASPSPNFINGSMDESLHSQTPSHNTQQPSIDVDSTMDPQLSAAPQYQTSASSHNPAQVSGEMHAELLKIFSSVSDRHLPIKAMPELASSKSQGQRPPPTRLSTASNNIFDTPNRASASNSNLPSSDKLAMPNRPRPSDSIAVNSLQQTHTPSPRNIRDEDLGHHRPTILTRIETLPKGHRILPPCDRCRRLRVDCIKNLSACLGCTKKHARCSWRDVSDQEMREIESMWYPFPFNSGVGSGIPAPGTGNGLGLGTAAAAVASLAQEQGHGSRPLHQGSMTTGVPLVPSQPEQQHAQSPTLPESESSALPTGSELAANGISSEDAEGGGSDRRSTQAAMTTGA